MADPRTKEHREDGRVPAAEKSSTPAAASARAAALDVQRGRLLEAMLAVCAEQGAGAVTAQRVIERAGMSRRTFYEHFENSEDCLAATLQDAIETAERRVLDACSGARSWRARMRAGLDALLSLCDEQPQLGRLLVVESLTATPRVQEHRETAIQRLIVAVDGGREHARTGAALSPITGEATVGAVLTAVHTRIVREDSSPLRTLLGELMSVIVTPYLGVAAARQELRRGRGGRAGR